MRVARVKARRGTTSLASKLALLLAAWAQPDRSRGQREAPGWTNDVEAGGKPAHAGEEGGLDARNGAGLSDTHSGPTDRVPHDDRSSAGLLSQEFGWRAST